MKRLRLLLAPIFLVFGFFVAPDPVEAHGIPSTTSRAICDYYLDGFEDQLGDYTWHLDNYRSFHYGSAHVTQCELENNFYSPDAVWCAQYVWNVPSPYWSSFAPFPWGLEGQQCWI